MKSLRLKILIPILIVAVAGLAGVALSGYFQAKEIVETDIEHLASSETDKLVSQIDGKLMLMKKEVQMLADTDAVRARDMGMLRQYISSRENMFEKYESLFIADRTGSYITITGKTGSIADRDYFYRVMDGETVVEDPLVSKETGNRVIVIASPVKDNTGSIIGLIAGTVEFSQVSDLIRSARLGDTGYAYMINREGIVVDHPQKELLSTNLLQHETQSLVEITEEMVNGEKGVGYYEFEGIKKIAAYAPLETSDWVMAMTTTYSEVAKNVNRLRNNAAIIGIIAVCLMIVITILLVNNTVKPLVEMARMTQEVAKGNLQTRVSVTTHDEAGLLARNFNQMIESMRELLLEMKETGMTVASSAQQMLASSEEASRASEEITQTIQDLAQGSTEQAAAAQNGSQTVEELVAGLNQIAINMADSEKLTVEANKAVESGVKTVEYQREKMVENKQAAVNVGERIFELSDKSQEIGQIIEAISDIADQTNLLALNAAIEAARAGEQGRGFAVVAEEVRKLAEEASLSTQKISALIRQIQQGIELAVEEMRKAEVIVGEQEKAVDSTTKAFDNVMDIIRGVTKQVQEVSKAVESLNEGASSTGAEIQNIASVAQENAAGTEEVAASAEEQTAAIQQMASSAENLAGVAQKLQEAIQRFKV